MLEKVFIILQQQCKIDAKNLLLVGVSGGPDSLCLLHILHQAGYPLIALHVNHGLRPEAEAEAQVVEHFAANLGVIFILCKVDVKAYSHDHSVSIEEAARILRYQSLFGQAKTQKVRAVVVGHTADDQVETILMHLLRGSGLSGLQGMDYRSLPNPWSKRIPLLRPLLSTWRAEVQRYVNENSLNPVSDLSNLDVSFLRNRVRHELIPLLESYNPSIREALFRMGESLMDDYSVLQEIIDATWRSILVQHGKGFLKFRLAMFCDLPLSVQRNILRKAMAHHLPGLRDVGFECIERGIKMLAGDIPGSQTDLISGLYLRKEGDYFWLITSKGDLHSREFPSILPGEVLRLAIPSTLDINNGWQLNVEEILDPKVINEHNLADSDPFQAWMDIGGINLPLIARPRQPGDRIRSLGLNGHTTKISDLMINLKLPRRARSAWPLICAGDEVLWVPGYRLSQLVRITPDTARALHLTLFQRQIS